MKAPKSRWTSFPAWGLIGLAVGCGTIPLPAEDAFPVSVPGRAAGMLVYTSNQDGNWEIYSRPVTDTESRRLTWIPQDDEGAMPSPDGKRLAFVSRRDGDYEIYVMNPDGTRQRRLTDARGIDEDPHWFPDGSGILFESARDGNWDIYRMNADGTNSINLTRTPFDEADPILSPEGGRILFKSMRDGHWRLYLMDLNGSDLIPLSESGYTEGAQDDPVWSPDGKRIVFVSGQEGHSEIYAMEVAPKPAARSVSAVGGEDRRGREGAVQNLTRHPAGDEGPAWSPDGRRIAFVSDRNGRRTVYVMNPDGMELMPIGPIPIHGGSPRWSSDGQWLAYVGERAGKPVICIVSVDGRMHDELAQTGGDIAEVQWVFSGPSVFTDKQ